MGVRIAWLCTLRHGYANPRELWKTSSIGVLEYLIISLCIISDHGKHYFTVICKVFADAMLFWRFSLRLLGRNFDLSQNIFQFCVHVHVDKLCRIS